MTDEKPRRLELPPSVTVTEEQIREWLDAHLGAISNEDRYLETPVHIEREDVVKRMVEWQTTRGDVISKAVRNVAEEALLPPELFLDFERFTLNYAVFLQKVMNLRPAAKDLAKAAYLQYVSQLPGWAKDQPASGWVN